jgi:hypothetical protein
MVEPIHLHSFVARVKGGIKMRAAAMLETRIVTNVTGSLQTSSNLNSKLIAAHRAAGDKAFMDPTQLRFATTTEL